MITTDEEKTKQTTCQLDKNINKIKLTAMRFSNSGVGMIGILPPERPNLRSSEVWTDSANQAQLIKKNKTKISWQIGLL